MKTITKWVATDGSEFADSAACLAYEKLCAEIDALMKDWPPVEVTGSAFVQQDRETVLRIQRAMVEIFERDHWSDGHTAWAKEAQIPAGLSLIGRYVDDAGHGPELSVWRRIARIDNLFREYEQPFYAVQANKII
jgi:hypothetical protein